jgi:hypothetical protein
MSASVAANFDQWLYIMSQTVGRDLLEEILRFLDDSDWQTVITRLGLPIDDKYALTRYRERFICELRNGIKLVEDQDDRIAGLGHRPCRPHICVDRFRWSLMDECYPVTSEGWKIIEGKVNESLVSGMKKKCRHDRCFRLYELDQLKEVVEIVANGNCRFPERYAALADTYCDQVKEVAEIVANGNWRFPERYAAFVDTYCDRLKEVVEIVANGNCRFPLCYAAHVDTYCSRDVPDNSTDIYYDIFRLLRIICIPSLLQEEKWKDFPIYCLRRGISNSVERYFDIYHGGYDYEYESDEEEDDEDI